MPIATCHQWATGNLSVAICWFSLTNYHLLIVISYWPFVSCHLLVIIGQLPFPSCQFPLAICWLSLANYHFLVVISHEPFVSCHLPMDQRTYSPIDGLKRGYILQKVAARISKAEMLKICSNFAFLDFRAELGQVTPPVGRLVGKLVGQLFDRSLGWLNDQSKSGIRCKKG